MKYKVMIILCVLLLCSGCSGIGSCEKGNLNLEKVFEAISKKMEQGDWKIGLLQDEPCSAERLDSLYQLSEEDVEEFMIKQAVIPASCGEIAIFHLLGKDTTKIETAINKRIVEMKKDMAILPNQIHIIENYKTALNNEYFIFVVGEDATNVIEYFNSL